MPHMKGIFTYMISYFGYKLQISWCKVVHCDFRFNHRFVFAKMSSISASIKPAVESSETQ